MHNFDDVNKRRRVDQKTISRCQAEIKEEEEVFVKEIVNTSMMDSIEDFDYQEINEQDYEIVYEASLPGVEDEPSVNSTPMNETPGRVKRKSKTLTFREKYEVIMQIENGASVPHVCEVYGIGRTTVYDYMRRKHEIIDFIEKSNDADRKTFKKSKFPEVEESVLEWCHERDYYTKQDFYQYAKMAFDMAREQGSRNNPSEFCGSWSWAKRFFHRHPQLKEKLITPSGQPIDPKELSLSNVEYLDENTTAEVGDEQLANNQLKKFLNLSEKLQVLDDIDSGKAVAAIAEKFNISKSTVYEIFKRRSELRDTSLTDIKFLRKVWKMPRYPQIELELLRWCLKQKVPLSNVLIADKALCIYEELGLSGSFNPSSAWAKKFVQRHPELYSKQSLKLSDQNSKDKDVNEENFIDELDTVIEDVDIDQTDPSYEFTNPDSMPDYEEEYIVEGLDPQLEEEDELQPDTEDEEPSNQKKILKIVKRNDESTLTPDIALKSLKILIKFSEQQGHNEMLSHLINYQAQLHENIS